MWKHQHGSGGGNLINFDLHCAVGECETDRNREDEDILVDKLDPESRGKTK